jgi:hypothetical protein
MNVIVSLSTRDSMTASSACWLRWEGESTPEAGGARPALEEANLRNPLVRDVLQ